MSKTTLFLIILVGVVAGVVALISWLWQVWGSIGSPSFLARVFGVAYTLFVLIAVVAVLVAALVSVNIWMNHRIWRTQKDKWSWHTTAINVVILLALAIGLTKIWSWVAIGWDKLQIVLGNGWVEFAFICTLLVALIVWEGMKRRRRLK